MKKCEILLYEMLEYQKGYGLSLKTVKCNEYLLKKFFRWLGDGDIREVDRQLIYEYEKHLKKTKSRFTGKPIKICSIELNMKVIKGFFDYLLRHEKILVNPMEGIRLSNKGEKRLRKIFTEEDIRIFLDSIGIDNAIELRDRAIFELIYSSGLRVGDIKNLEVEHLNIEERVLLIRGKGGKDAYIPFSETAQQFLINYLNRVRKLKVKKIQRKLDKRYVFIGMKGRMDYGCFLNRFHGYLKKCGLDKKGYTIHSIRHATATHLLSHGASIRYVQELLRHEDLKTTQLYSRPTVENVKAVYVTYHPRCNEYYREVTKEYLGHVNELKERLIWGRKANARYKKKGHKRGIGNWNGSSK